MNWIGIITKILTAVDVLVCLLLILLVLLQRPKNEGLGAAFGGDTASNIFGAQTTNVLANLTRWLGAAFLALGLVIAVLGTHDADRQGRIGAYLDKQNIEKAERDRKKKAEDDAAKAAAAAAEASKTPSPAQPAPGPTAPGQPEAPSTTVLPPVPVLVPGQGDKPSPEIEKPGETKPNEKKPSAATPGDGKPSANPAPPITPPASTPPTPPAPAKAPGSSEGN
jgi:preprotein translocase subunit SecG